MLLNGARGLSEPQASCPECRFAFKHFFSPLEVPGFWNGARNIPLHSQNTILQILRSIPDTLLKPFSELNSGKAMNPCILLLFIPSCVTVQEIIQRCSCRCLYHSLKASHFRSSDIEHKTRQ